MTWIDGAIVFLFLLYALVSGIRSRTVASRNLEEYFLADRSLSGRPAGVSMAATQFAADIPLLVTDLVATSGVFACWRPIASFPLSAESLERCFRDSEDRWPNCSANATTRAWIVLSKDWRLQPWPQYLCSLC